MEQKLNIILKGTMAQLEAEKLLQTLRITKVSDNIFLIFYHRKTILT
jgi:hypothetical protein